jgi:uncharacterized UBP type Zn finger protein
VSCQHILALSGAPVASAGAPSTVDGCPECVEQGFDDWVHLRECLECGHVGCCDSSPRRHATAHYLSTRHPVMRSLEPGEAWRWCFVDEVIG